MIIHKEINSTESQNMRLYYYRQHPRLPNKDISKQVKLQIIQGHCHKFFGSNVTETESNNNEGSGTEKYEEEMDLNNQTETQENATIEYENDRNAKKVIELANVNEYNSFTFLYPTIRGILT